MNEKPILFSGAMVRAILDGTKTMTRRIVNPQPKDDCHIGRPDSWIWKGYHTGQEALCRLMEKQHPFGQKLWVRENAIFQLCDKKKEKVLHYQADGHEALDSQVWTPSIHMPRWASRIKLEVTGVRVQRLQEISEADALAEGIDRTDLKLCHVTPQNVFRKLWDKLNAKRKGGIYAWGKDPFVWVVAFRKL